MWNAFLYNDENYLIKFNNNQQVCIYLTNFKKMWSEKITQDEIFKRFQKENPIIEANADTCVEQVELLIKNICTENINFTIKDDCLNLAIKEKISDIPMKFEIYLTPENADVLLHELTVPLVQTVFYLEAEQKKLRDLLKNKDIEIEEYQMEYGEITRKSIKTEKFNENTWFNLQKHNLFLNVFGKCKQFWNTLIVKYGDLIGNSTIVKKEENAPVRKKMKVYSAKTVSKSLGRNYNAS